MNVFAILASSLLLTMLQVSLLCMFEKCKCMSAMLIMVFICSIFIKVERSSVTPVSQKGALDVICHFVGSWGSQFKIIVTTYLVGNLMMI